MFLGLPLWRTRIYKSNIRREVYEYGKADCLVESTPALYAGIACYIVAGAIKAFFRKAR